MQKTTAMINGAVMIALLVGGAGMSGYVFVTPELREAVTKQLPPNEYVDGKITATIESSYEDELPIRKPSGAVLNALTYSLFGEGRKGVVVGEAGWLFSAEEYDWTPQSDANLRENLKYVGEVAREYGFWFHVDGAYGAGALAAPSVRHLFDGIELVDSLIVDPHKWLFAPFDACALLYREPALGRAAHTQHAGYLDPVTVDGEWNPSDFAIQLTRRARGLPFWFSLAVYGTDAYRDAIEHTLTVAREGLLLEDRTERAAGAAPLRPEVDDDRRRLRSLDDLLLEVLLGDVDHGHVS